MRTPISEDTKRASVMKMLSDAESTRVAAAEEGALVKHGEEYLDLENLDEGVHRAFGTAPSRPGRLLPRRLVGDSTWNAILVELAPRQQPETD